MEKVQSANPLGSLPGWGGEATHQGEVAQAGQLGTPTAPVLPGAYESMLLVVPIRDIMPLGQKSLTSRLPRRG